MRYAHLSVVLVVVMLGVASADDFVPFVIGPKPNPQSAIAVTSYEPIAADSERLVTRKDDFYWEDKRVRLWGVNLSFGANFPQHVDAPHIAARLAAAGVNTVRCHHMDTSRWPRGIWNAKDGKTIAPEALDRLDYFINELAKHGIFVNINLHVGRAHSDYMDLPKTNRQYDKILGIFTPALIEAQKQFARDLLGHTNRYRNVRYADDPAVAIVEITNEDSFFMWGAQQTLRTLPPYYAKILQDKYNNWLASRYGSDDKLRQAWSEGTARLGANQLKNGDLKLDGRTPENWSLEQHEGCKASLSRRRHNSRDALQVNPMSINDTSWHLQLNQGGLPVITGQYYTVTFDAAADAPRSIGGSVGQAHDPWSNLGLSRQVSLTRQWKRFRFGFVAKASDENARVSFAFGGDKTPFYLANVQFRPGGRVGLGEEESLNDENISLFAENEGPIREVDRMIFLAETEKEYFDDMWSFIKVDMGCDALVTGTIVFGPLGLYAQKDMDFIDAHAYWQHPRFPGRPWDPGNWLIDQKPMTDYPQQATLFRLAAGRLEDKPFTVSEYNHPAPLDSQAECVPMIASFGAAQDWDGIWLYTYSHSGDNWRRENINSYFDIDTNPAKWGFMRAGTAIFRDDGMGGLSRRDLLPLIYSGDVCKSLARSHLRYDRDLFGFLAGKLRFDWKHALETEIVPSLDPAYRPWSVSRLRPGKLTWSVDDGKGLYRASSQRVRVYTGHADRLAKATSGGAAITSPQFVALTMTSLDDKPFSESEEVLITACGRCENTGMKFSQDRRTVGRNWGGPPSQIEAVTGKMTLPKGKWRCRALGPDGLHRDDVPVRRDADKAVIDLSPKYKTMWYLLTRQ